jgi:hypothetical protein
MQKTTITTALHWAAGGGHEVVLLLLLEKGADVKARIGVGRWRSIGLLGASTRQCGRLKQMLGDRPGQRPARARQLPMNCHHKLALLYRKSVAGYRPGCRASERSKKDEPAWTVLAPECCLLNDKILNNTTVYCNGIWIKLKLSISKLKY